MTASKKLPSSASWKHPALACFVLGLGLAQPIPGSAQEPAADLETITVTGTRVPRSEPQIGSMTVIDEQSIEARNDSNVLDLLRDVPGVHVSLPGGRGNLGSIFIRGSEPNYGAVLLDGIQVNDPTNTRGGSFDFSTLDIDAIERIEILRAPQSSVYGSDALSGVINVITHSGSETLTAGADVELGSQDYSRAGVQLGGPSPRGGLYSVRLGGITEGDSADPAQFQSHSLSGKFASETNAPFDFSVYGRHASADATAFPDDSGGDRLAVLREKGRRETKDTSVGFDAASTITGRTSLHIAGSLFEHDEQVASPGVAPGVRNAIPENSGNSDFSRSAVNVFLTSEFNESLDAAYGIGYQKEAGTGSSLITLGPQFVLPTSYELDRDNLGVYGEIDYRASRAFSVAAALRVDDTDSAGTANTGRITLAYELPGRATRLHLTWGEGFKLPSLFALADPLVGNPTLQPETADSWELGVLSAHLDGRLQWQLAAFDQRFSNLIDFDSDTFMIVNRSRVDSGGFELSADFRASDHWLLSAHATSLDIDVLDAGIELRQRPERTGGLRLEWTPSQAWGAYVGVHYVGERFDSSVPTGGQTLPSHHSVDLTVNHQLSRSVTVSLAVDNVTDEQFEPAIGFPDLGRRVRLSIRGAFNGLNTT